MFNKSVVLAAMANVSFSGFGEALDLMGGAPRYGHTTPTRNGGTPSGAAASKRAAAKRRNVRARGRK